MPTTVELRTQYKDLLESFIREQQAEIQAENQDIEAEAKALQAEATIMTRRMELLGVPAQKMTAFMETQGEVAKKAFDKFMAEVKPLRFEAALQPPLLEPIGEPEATVLALGRIDEKVLPEPKPLPGVPGAYIIKDRVTVTPPELYERHDQIFMVRVPQLIFPRIGFVRVEFHGTANLWAGESWRDAVARANVYMQVRIQTPFPPFVATHTYPVLKTEVRGRGVRIPINKYFILHTPWPTPYPMPMTITGRIAIIGERHVTAPMWGFAHTDIDFQTGSQCIRICTN